MNKTRYEKYSKKQKPKTDWSVIDAIKDDEIDYSEIPEADEEFYKNAKVADFRNEELVTLPISKLALGWYNKQGNEYWKLMSAILNEYAVRHGAKLNKKANKLHRKNKHAA